MRDLIIYFIVIIFSSIIGVKIGNSLIKWREETEISFSSILYKDVIEIKRNCSEDVSYIIREVLADDKLTYREYDYIKSEYKKENNKKILEELKK